MNIKGTIYLVDEPHLDVLKQNLKDNPPPGGRVATGTMLCFDMDDGNNILEVWFPDHCQKSTILCPPPIAMYKEIDGDQEGFIEEYNRYLDYEESVQDFLGSMLLFLHLGGNILLYSPSYIEDDAIWIQTLVMYFFTRFGITIGTPTSAFAYDPRYDGQIADFIYSRGVMDIFDYLESCTDIRPPLQIQDRIVADILPMCSLEEDPLEVFARLKIAQMNGCHIIAPAITFER